ncbi:cystathionine gamma-synthase 1, chloroplastic-like [Iris pallida]|uniref:Cystathionine gamma-synthase 1, chloroplastic-like n=1 Tax=Iris pallida TaxID=29817 RepID=A0AAX6EV89_IRIPA|nr:cystathionine gamma-synthase 1, chloroplastic-like [Iris pallida]
MERQSKKLMRSKTDQIHLWQLSLTLLIWTPSKRHWTKIIFVSLFFTETPTNPFLHCVDIKLVSELCHQNGALVFIDGTFATPVNQKALTLGADIVVNSGTKFIAGHNDVISGCVSGPEELIAQFCKFHHLNGGVLGPHAAYMVLRGMKTLHLRVQYQNSLALLMAQFLEEHPKSSIVHIRTYKMYFDVYESFRTMIEG